MNKSAQLNLSAYPYGLYLIQNHKKNKAIQDKNNKGIGLTGVHYLSEYDSNQVLCGLIHLQAWFVF
jgi:hypothetical protein